MAQNAEIFFEHDSGDAPLLVGRLPHRVTAVILLYPILFNGGHGSDWGSGGGGSAMGVTLSVPFLYPRRPTRTRMFLANESKGLTKSQPKIEEKEPDAIEIQGKNTKVKPRKFPPHQGEAQPALEEETNQVASAKADQSAVPTAPFAAGGAKGGFGVTGGGGDFGTKFGWYVQIIQRKVQKLAEVRGHPRVTGGQRVYITFDVARDGHPFNVQIEQSSGVPSLDVSATRALQRIDTFGPLRPTTRQEDLSRILVRLQQKIKLCTQCPGDSLVPNSRL